LIGIQEIVLLVTLLLLLFGAKRSPEMRRSLQDAIKDVD
jgi:Sec-independent protein translocase protein TatA